MFLPNTLFTLCLTCMLYGFDAVSIVLKLEKRGGRVEKKGNLKSRDSLFTAQVVALFQFANFGEEKPCVVYYVYTFILFNFSKLEADLVIENKKHSN